MTTANLVKRLFVVAVIAALLGCSPLDEEEGPAAGGGPVDDKAPPRSDDRPEARAIWIASSYFSNDKAEATGEIDDALDELGTIGIGDIFCFHVMKDQNDKDWDFLELLLDAAHARGMRVHPCWCPGHVYPSWKDEIVTGHPEWLIQNLKENTPGLNFAIEDVREFVLGKIARVLEYDIDGIQLDGIRFQTGQGYSYDEATCKAFKEEYGKGPLELRWHNCGSVLWCEWMRWNASHVTTLVKQIKDLIEESGKDIPLSVAVFPDHESAKLLIGQDWQRWAEEGIVDILCPMLYTSNHEAFRKYVQRAVDVAPDACRVYAGIAVKIARCENSPEGLAEQVEISREEGADGVVFFYGGDLLKGEYAEKLRSGVFGSK